MNRFNNGSNESVSHTHHNQGSDQATQAGSECYAGQPWLVEERDACGVGFIADMQARASHDIIQKALPALTCMEHRGGCSADQESGDGAGLMTAVPWDILTDWLQTQGITPPPVNQLGVGMIFLPTPRPSGRFLPRLAR